MTEHLGLRERKKRDRRRIIEAAALSRFEKNGFDATTIDEIDVVYPEDLANAQT